MAIAYIQARSWEQAEEIILLIQDQENREKALSVLAISLAKNEQWECACYTLDAIHNGHQRIIVIREWGAQLGQGESNDQQEKIVHYLNNAEEKARLLTYMAEELGKRGQYLELAYMIQRAWLQANTKDDCLYLFAMARRLFLKELGMIQAFYDVFGWIDAHLKRIK